MHKGTQFTCSEQQVAARAYYSLGGGAAATALAQVHRGTPLRMREGMGTCRLPSAAKEEDKDLMGSKTTPYIGLSGCFGRGCQVFETQLPDLAIRRQ
jgi:hypothetical protein